ncbi:MAG: hypothetical protein DRO90_01640 [Candidatus Altiarchaeales archaeon]|nr:MAG: hypothetical protein DRO95_04390 [Candidatus Altiarchaeales archaeon]RLI93690.1 MAG: hypothetical protein DRO94_04605 [Candidatus Altiarchaeales archaeon]RLI94696.1 MAG: hypothetical protein DRO90_01640 [Candidatus Altiarchaeales archaeon]HDO82677.1 DUF115 domain-containing protein [Candidatus Altiarchaeales archaeon]HEX55326.1 DUF115 domain-containing protein [Candidatus Altiarchaeales archaeon]
MSYEKIKKLLGLDEEGDLKAAEILNEIVDKPDTDSIKELIRGACVIVFGAGPSLEKDIEEIKRNNLAKKCVVIAADGALVALMKNGILPEILVTDLDGDLERIERANRLGVITVVHAHSDNIEILKKFVPRLRRVIGTTQVGKFSKLMNFGGFTDGDRAVYLADYFHAEMILLAGMDFGEKIGKYSGRYDEKLKPRKLRIGKKLIENLAKKSNSLILDLTSDGKGLYNIPKISVKNAKKLLMD